LAVTHLLAPLRYTGRSSVRLPCGGCVRHYDKSSKRLIEHHGDSILRLAGARDFTTWAPLAAGLVQSRRLPDGVIEVRNPGETVPDVCILAVTQFLARLRYNHDRRSAA
jgi:hypothetical protein